MTGPPSAEYNSGNVFIEDDPARPVPEPEWLLTILDGAISHFLSMISAPNASYILFGHSAGAQLAHRYRRSVLGLRVKFAHS